MIKLGINNSFTPNMSLGLNSIRAAGVGGGFDPRSLFSGGGLGAWYESGDLSTLFQDSAGTIPVTAAGQPVGRQLDKSGNGNHRTFSGDAPTLSVDANGKFFLSFDGVNDQLVVPTSTGLFKFMHDGTGGSCWIAASCAAGANRFPIGTDAGTNTGFRLGRLNTTSRPQFVVTGGAANVIIASPASGAPWAADAATVVGATYRTGVGSDAFVYVNGVEVANSAELTAPSSANSASNLLSPTAPTSGGVVGTYGLVIINRVLTATERNNLDDYFQRLTGVFF